MFSDYKTHVLGVPDNDKLGYSDKGQNETYAFRTPTLRNLKFPAPFMHNGKFNTLEEVLRFYNRVKKNNSRDFRNPHVNAEDLDPILKFETLEDQDIVEFLLSLSDNGFDRALPLSVPSKLRVGGNIY